MKKLELVKIMVVVGLSLIMVLSITNLVLAADEDDFDWDNAIVTNNSVDNSASNNASTDNSVTSNTNNSVVNNSSTYNNTSIANNILNTSATTTNANKLANTGVSNFNGTIALVIVLGVIVAIYSYKKVNEYKNV